MHLSAVVRPRPSALVAALAFSLAAGVAEARPTPLVGGSAALGRAREAWTQADFDVAETAYKEALDRGSLTRDETLECYAHLGAARVILGRKDQASSAFRVAAALDPRFVVPPEAGKKAVALADKERKQTIPFKLDLTSPVEVKPRASFAIGVTLESAQLALVARVGLVVRDPVTSKEFHFDEQPRGEFRFFVPESMTAPGAALDVVVRALDAHDNELVEQETRVVVTGSREPLVKADPPPVASGGFWHTPWPWVIGGALVAAGGGVGLYYALRPPSDVTVGAPRVQAN